MTHRFHPLSGRVFEFVEHRHNWGEDRVHLHDEDGVLFSLPAVWTDVAAADPFVVIADGRCPFTTGCWARILAHGGDLRLLVMTRAVMRRSGIRG